MTTQGDQDIFYSQVQVQIAFGACEPKIRVEKSNANKSVQGHTTKMHTATFFQCFNLFWNTDAVEGISAK